MKSLILSFIALTLGLTLSAQNRNPQNEADREWMESGVWNNGWNVRCHPSVNATEFANQYKKNKQLWDKAFSYLASHDLDSIPNEKIVIEEGRCWIKMSEYEPRTADDVNIEQHHNFIDLQYTFRGNELMGLAYNVTEKNPYNPKKDVGHYNSEDVDYFPAKEGEFFLFFPSDYHQPSVRAEGDPVTSRKLVVKMEYIPD